MESLHELHEDWLIRKKYAHPGAPVLIMDADKGKSVLYNVCNVIYVMLYNVIYVM